MKKPDLFSWYTVIQPGLEDVLADELAELGQKPTPEPGGVGFQAPLLVGANLVRRLRVPGRLLLVLGQGRATTADELAAVVRRFDWKPLIPIRAELDVHVTTERTRLHFRDSLEKKVAWAVKESLKGPRVMELEPKVKLKQRISVRIIEDKVTVSLDVGGELLHKRGWRTSVSEAPIRENVAAALLRKARWNGQEALLDPFCGSGTFLIEGALQAMGRSPFTRTDFACSEWPALKKAWKEDKIERVPGLPILMGSDRDAKSVVAARDNGLRAKVEGIRWAKLDVEEVEAPAPSGLLLCNPPYGERLIEGEAYRKLGRLAGGKFEGWRVFFLAPGTDLADGCAKMAGRTLKGRGVFANGGLKVGFWELL